MSIPISQRQSLLIIFFVYSSRNFVCICKACELPQWLSDKESARNAGDVGSIPGLGRSPGGGKCNPFQYSCLRNSMDRGAWQTTVHGVTKRTALNNQNNNSMAHRHIHMGKRTHLHALTFFFPRSDNIIHTVLQLAFFT